MKAQKLLLLLSMACAVGVGAVFISDGFTRFPPPSSAGASDSPNGGSTPAQHYGPSVERFSESARTVSLVDADTLAPLLEVSLSDPVTGRVSSVDDAARISVPAPGTYSLSGSSDYVGSVEIARTAANDTVYRVRRAHEVAFNVQKRMGVPPGLVLRLDYQGAPVPGVRQRQAHQWPLDGASVQTMRLLTGTWRVTSDPPVPVTPELLIIKRSQPQLLLVGGIGRNTLVGKVIDATGTACAGVDVAIAGSSDVVTTDEAGEFRLYGASTPAFLDVAVNSQQYESLRQCGPFVSGREAPFTVQVQRRQPCLLIVDIDAVRLERGQIGIWRANKVAASLDCRSGESALPFSLRDGDRLLVSSTEFQGVGVCDTWRVIEGDGRERVFYANLVRQSVEIRVVDALNGGALANAKVEVVAAPLAGKAPVWRRALKEFAQARELLCEITCDASGLARLPGLVGDRHEVSASLEGYEPGRLVVGHSNNIRLPLMRTADIAGSIKSGPTVSDLPQILEFVRVSDGVTRTAVVSNGRFVVRDTADGVYHVTLLVGAPAQRNYLSLGEHDMNAARRLDLDASAITLVSVEIGTDPAMSRGLAMGDRVSLIPMDRGAPAMSGRIDAALKTTLLVPPGKYCLVARGRDPQANVATATRMIDVPPQNSMLAHIGFSGCAVRLRVVGRNGVIPNAWVSLPGGEMVSCDDRGEALLADSLASGTPVRVVSCKEGLWETIGSPVSVQTDVDPDGVQVCLVRMPQ